MSADINNLIAQHRAGMHYLHELRGMAAASEWDTNAPLAADFLGPTPSGPTIIDEAGNIISDAFPSVAQTAQNVVSTTKNYVIIGAVIVGAIVVLPHLLDYMTARRAYRS